jgi:hypothetical protein
LRANRLWQGCEDPNQPRQGPPARLTGVDVPAETKNLHTRQAEPEIVIHLANLQI